MTILIGHDAESQLPIYLSEETRMSGLYVLGKSGMGKTVFLINMMAQQLAIDNGLFCIDPHGDIAESLGTALSHPSFASLNPENSTHAFGINLLSCADTTNWNAIENTYQRAYNAFARIWEKDFLERPWLQLFMQNALYAFIENQDYTLAELPMFFDTSMKDFREHIVSNIKQSWKTADFWKAEFARPEREQRERMDAALTRVETLLGHKMIFHIVGQKKTTIDFTTIVEENKALLLNLSANLSLDQKRFLSTIILSELLTAVRKRSTQNPKLFAVYIDEAQHFVYSEDFSTLFTEARKFGIATTIAHQERYGQLADNIKVKGATLAAVNKVCFQLTAPDAEELAPEFAERVSETDAYREPVLLPSPHVIEDIWDRGHNHKQVADLRVRYFWLVELLRKNPQEKYFTFNPRNAFYIHEGNTGNLHVDQFEDWGMYRANAEMLQTGISLLNQYYYDWMTGKYNRSDPISEREVQLFLKIIECIGGVLGFRETMNCYIPPEKWQLLLNALNKQQVERLKEYLSDIQPPRPDTDWHFQREYPDAAQIQQEMYKRYLQRYEDQRRDVRAEIALIRDRDGIQKPIYFTARQAEKMPAFAIRQGVPASEANNFVEWDIRELTSPEREVLTVIVRETLNARLENVNQANVQNAIEKYTTILSGITLIDMLGIDYKSLSSAIDSAKLRLVAERIAWQINEMRVFILKCSYCVGTILQQKPLYVPSGQYEERMRIEQTQANLNAEMARELMRLNKFTAYTKYMEKNGEIWTLKMTGLDPRKIINANRTASTPGLHKQLGEKLYCQERSMIEYEIRERQKKWRNADERKRFFKEPTVIVMDRKNDPPPRRS